MGGAMDLVVAPGTKTIITMVSLNDFIAKIPSFYIKFQLKFQSPFPGTQQQRRLAENPQRMFFAVDR